MARHVRRLLLILLAGLPLSANSAEYKQLQHLKGVVGCERGEGGAFTRVLGRFDLPDDYYAVTREAAAALLVLPDSSIIGLGENTNVKLGAFNRAAAGPGSTVTVRNGTLRFDIRRPQGGTANNRFTTPATQIAVRGTVGVLSVDADGTKVGCIACGADSVSLASGGKTYALHNGQLATVDPSGNVTIQVFAPEMLAAFRDAGVSVSASSGSDAATAGVVTSGKGGQGSGEQFETIKN